MKAKTGSVGNHQMLILANWERNESSNQLL